MTDIQPLPLSRFQSSPERTSAPGARPTGTAATATHWPTSDGDIARARHARLLQSPSPAMALVVPQTPPLAQSYQRHARKLLPDATIGAAPWLTATVASDAPVTELIAAIKEKAIVYARASGVNALYGDYDKTIEELLTPGLGPRLSVELFDQASARRRSNLPDDPDINVLGFVDPTDPNTIHLDLRVARYPAVAADVLLHELIHHLELNAQGKSSERVAGKIDQMLHHYHMYVEPR